MYTIFQICVEGNTGSTGRIAESIGWMAIQRGWQSYIAHGRFPRNSKSNIIKIGTKWDVIVHGLQTRLFDRHGLGSKKATQILIEQIKRINPDIIHLHHIHGYYVNMQVLFEFLASISTPIVWTFHDCWSITGHCAHFDFIGCDKWRTECRNCPQTKEYPASMFIDRSRENYRLKKKLFTSVSNMTIVSVSKWLDGLVGDSFLRHSKRVVIYNGIDTDLFIPETDKNVVREKYGIGTRFMILGVASPWGEKKGLNDFVKLSKIIGSDEVVVLVGLNDAQIKNLPKNIIGITKTENQQQLKELYATANVFFNPTWEDSFPTTNLEALACGTPVITYRTGGSIESVSGDTGFVVDKGNLKEVVQSINKIKSTGKSSYVNVCRNRAISYFNKKDRFAEYISLYEKLLDTKSH